MLPAPINPATPTSPDLTPKAQALMEAVADCLNFSAQNEKIYAVAQAVASQHEIRYITKSQVYYYKDPITDLYRPLSDRILDRWVGQLWLKFPTSLGAFTEKVCDSTTRTIKKLVSIEEEKEMPTIPKRYIKVADNLYWDQDLGELSNDVPEQEVFYRLLDTDAPTRHTPKLPPFTPEQVQHMLLTYKDTIEHLKAHDGDLEETYPFVQVWADHNHDNYMDIMRVTSYCFIKEKPSGAVLLIGSTRNGKSSFVGLLHTIFGLNNTSMVKMSEIGDSHHVIPLANTLLNAPDEEDKHPVQHTDFFKTITDHGMANFPLMRSAEPVSIRGDFMCFFPMNHLPDWKDTEAQALINRSWPIMFEADLKAEDDNPVNFEQTTYTTEMLSDFLGTIFALANYYTRHPIVKSAKMKSEQNALTEDSNSATLYLPQFEQFFDGFTTWNFVYDDYIKWCDKNEVPYVSKAQFKFAFKRYRGDTAKRRVTIGEERVRVRQLPQPNKHLLHEGFIASEFNEKKYDKEIKGKTVDDLHLFGTSIVYELKELYADKLYEAQQANPQPQLEDEIFTKE